MSEEKQQEDQFDREAGTMHFDKNESNETKKSTGSCLSFRVGHFITLYLASTTGVLSGLYYYYQNHLSLLVVALLFFLSLNVLICIWEIALGLHITVIKRDHKQLVADGYAKKPMLAILNFFNEPLTVTHFFSLAYWSKVWAV